MLVFMKQYGKTILFSLAVVSVFFIAFRMRVNGADGFIKAIYGKAMGDMDMAGVREFGDANATKAAAARSLPRITFRYKKILPGKPVDLTAMLAAEDADGNRVGVEITDIKTEEGESLLYRTQEDRENHTPVCSPSEVLFPTVGIYIMDTMAQDSERKTVKAQFRIPVTGI